MSDVYFDESSGNYWYWDSGTSQWSMTQTLPTTITVVEKQRYPITYKGDDPWKNNAADLKKYKSKNGKEKMKGSGTKVKSKDKQIKKPDKKQGPIIYGAFLLKRKFIQQSHVMPVLYDVLSQD